MSSSYLSETLRILFLSIIFGCIANKAIAQPGYEIAFNTTSNYVIKPYNKNSNIIFGFTSVQYNNIQFTLLDTGLNIIWNKAHVIDSLNPPFPGIISVHIEGLLVDTISSSKGFIVYGSKNAPDPFSGFQYKHYFIFKTDTVGNYQWSKRAFISADIDDGIITSDSQYVFPGALYIFKMNPADGNITWQRSFMASGNHIMRTVSTCTMADGSIGMTGLVILGTAADFHVSKMDLNGNVIWSKAIGDSLPNRPWEIRMCNDGGLIVIGESDYGMNSDFLVVKLDSSGNLLWGKTYGVPGNEDEGYHVEQTSDGGFIMGGITTHYNPNQSVDYSRALVIKTDSMGNTKWSKMYPVINGWSYLLSIAKTYDEGIILSNGYLVKTDTAGNSCSSIDTVVTQQIWTAAPVSFAAVPLGSIQVDTNIVIPGTTSDSIIDICNLLSVHEPGNQQIPMSVFPNPSSQIINIALSTFLQSSILEIFDPHGRLVISKSYEAGANEFQLDVSELNSGIYFSRIIDSSGRMFSSRISIAH